MVRAVPLQKARVSLLVERLRLALEFLHRRRVGRDRASPHRVLRWVQMSLWARGFLPGCQLGEPRLRLWSSWWCRLVSRRERAYLWGRRCSSSQTSARW